MGRDRLFLSWDEVVFLGLGSLGILACVSMGATSAEAQAFGRGGRPVVPQSSPSPPRKVMRYNVPVAEPDRLGGRPMFGGGLRFPHHGHFPAYPIWGIPNFAYPGVGFPLTPGFGPPWGPLPPIGHPGWQQPLPILTPSLVPGGWFPQSLLIESDVVANPPLPPAQLWLVNSGPRELQVGIIDLTQPDQRFSTRVPAGGEVEVSLERDSGATRTARYQTYDAWGFPIVQEVVTEIAPSVRYELIVHEWAIQSIAIDRTGKSPNPIEDINFQGRGIGRFPLPAGEELASGTIDVYRAALAAENPGVVAPLIPSEQQQTSDKASILERAILDAQRRALSNPRARKQP